uniref:Uncharacterized protein n=1 Tax=Meloidogyne javanica TaxID=6303 RepID=A0A915LY51_MELJA
MSASNNPVEVQHDLTQDEALARNILREEVNVINVGDQNAREYWILKFLTVVEMKKTGEGMSEDERKKMKESYEGRVAELTSKNLFLQFRNDKLEKEALKTAMASEGTLLQQQRADISPTVSPSKPASPSIIAVHGLCIICETNPTYFYKKEYWLCGSCYSSFTNRVKAPDPCSNNGKCEKSQLLKCQHCRLAKFKKLGIVKTPRKREGKKDEGSSTKKPKLAGSPDKSDEDVTEEGQ